MEAPLFEQEFEKITQQMRLAHSLGIRTMRIDVVRWDTPAERRRAEHFIEDLPIIIQTYQALCERAEPYGITVLIENHGLCMNGADRMRMVVKGVNRPNFGAQLDVGNFLCVDDDPVIAIQKTVDLAVTVHFKDFYVRPADQYPGAAQGYDDAWFKSSNGTYLRGAVTGHGDVDVRRVMRILKQAGFDGNIFLEFEGVEECRWASATGLANMRRLWEQA